MVVISEKYGRYGLRDMTLFNQAMLGRQCWRLLTEPTSLCARVLKGRYFPDGDFWNATCPRSASYTWRSILYGKKLVEKGVLCGISDGATTRITQDRWIPGVHPCLVKPLVPLTEGQTVASLIESRSWDEAAVRAVFDEDIANKVLQIPISRFGGDDFITWPHNRLGIYTVRSAYFLAREDSALKSRSGRGRGMSSGYRDEAASWKSLWAICAPGKMKITLWRFAHDCLPSGHQLQHRHVPASYLCIHCGTEERVEHAMLFCPFAREVWNSVKDSFSVQLNRQGFANPKQWLFDFLKRCSKQDATVLAVSFWHLWDTRNRLRLSIVGVT